MGWKKEILHLFNVIPTPTAVYEDLDRSPRWRIPLVFLLISSVIIGWFMIPAMIEPMRKIFESSFGSAGAQAAMNGVMKSMVVAQLLIAPAVVMLRWFVLAGILFLLAMIFAGDGGNLFKRLFSAVAYAEIIFVFMNLLTLLILNLRGIERIESAYDMTIFKGLEVLLPDRDAHPTLSTLLSNINPFAIWYIITISVGFRVMTKSGKAKAIALAGIAWLVWVFLSELQAIISRLLLGTLA